MDHAIPPRRRQSRLNWADVSNAVVDDMAECVASVPTCGELVLEGKGLWLGHLDGLTLDSNQLRC